MAYVGTFEQWKEEVRVACAHSGVKPPFPPVDSILFSSEQNEVAQVILKLKEQQGIS